MPLLKGGNLVADPYAKIADEEPLPTDPGADIIVSLERLAEQGEAFASRTGRLGIQVANTTPPEEIAPHLAGVALIELPFPAFTDGRAYSLARLIRERLAFAGELRASGDVLPDQLAFLRQVGFDAFEISEGAAPLDVWQRTASTLTLTYQGEYRPATGFAAADIFARRHAAAETEEAAK